MRRFANLAKAHCSFRLLSLLPNNFSLLAYQLISRAAVFTCNQFTCLRAKPEPRYCSTEKLIKTAAAEANTTSIKSRQLNESQRNVSFANNKCVARILLNAPAKYDLPLFSLFLSELGDPNPIEIPIESDCTGSRARSMDEISEIMRND